MSRPVSGAFLTALTDQVVRPAIFFEGVFGPGTVRFWSGLGDVSWSGQTWTGAGTLLGLSSIDEPTDVVAAGFTVSLSGVPVDLVSAVLVDVLQGDAGRIWVGLIDVAGALIADPVLAAAGRLDQPVISEDGETCLIEVAYEGRLIDLYRPREWRYTHESQQQLYPGDRGFEYVAGLQDREIMWGAASQVGAAIPVKTAAPAGPQVGQPGGSVYRPSAGAPGFLGNLKVPAATGKTDQYRTNGVWVGNKNN